MDEDLSDSLINALDSERNVIPSELITIKRMLLYICHIYKYNVHSHTEEDFYSEAELLNNLWELMRLTYNKKYPEAVMSTDDLKAMRQKIGQLNTANLTYEEMNDVFGDHNKFDIFFFGIYSTYAMKQVGKIGEDVKETTVILETSGLERLVIEEKKKYQRKNVQEEDIDSFWPVLEIIWWVTSTILGITELFISLVASSEFLDENGITFINYDLRLKIAIFICVLSVFIQWIMWWIIAKFFMSIGVIFAFIAAFGLTYGLLEKYGFVNPFPSTYKKRLELISLTIALCTVLLSNIFKEFFISWILSLCFEKVGLVLTLLVLHENQDKIMKKFMNKTKI